jgi:arylformamidase
MRILTPFLVLVLASSLLADEPKVHRGLPYADTKNERQTLDVYAPTKGKNLPVVVWIHGGGWQEGDKKDVSKKPQVFSAKGFVEVLFDFLSMVLKK